MTGSTSTTRPPTGPGNRRRRAAAPTTSPTLDELNERLAALASQVDTGFTTVADRLDRDNESDARIHEHLEDLIREMVVKDAERKDAVELLKTRFDRFEQLAVEGHEIDFAAQLAGFDEATVRRIMQIRDDEQLTNARLVGAIIEAVGQGRQRYESLARTVGEVRRDLDNLASRVGGHDTDIADLRTDVDDVTETVERHTGLLDDQTAALERYANTTNTAFERVRTEHTELVTRVDGISKANQHTGTDYAIAACVGLVVGLVVYIAVLAVAGPRDASETIGNFVHATRVSAASGRGFLALMAGLMTAVGVFFATLGIMELRRTPKAPKPEPSAEPTTEPTVKKHRILRWKNKKPASTTTTTTETTTTETTTVPPGTTTEPPTGPPTPPPAGTTV
jgi:hypothetical protein